MTDMNIVPNVNYTDDPNTIEKFTERVAIQASAGCPIDPIDPVPSVRHHETLAPLFSDYSDLEINCIANLMFHDKNDKCRGIATLLDQHLKCKCIYVVRDSSSVIPCRR